MAIYESIPDGGRYEQDVFNDFLLRYARYTIKDALNWLCANGQLRKCGTTLRPIYIHNPKPEKRVTYTNIRPIHGVDALLQMHRNFTEEKPR